MQRRGRAWPALIVAAMVVVVAACGTLRVPGASSSAQPSGKPSEPLCPQAAAAVPASSCVSAGVQQYQQSNEMYNERIPLPAWRVTQAAPETRRIRQALERLSAAQRLKVPAVRSALLAAGLQQQGLVVITGPPYTGVTFGGYEPFTARPIVCAWGYLTAKKLLMYIGGITREGACAP